MNQNKPLVGWYYQSKKDKELVFVKETKTSDLVVVVPLVGNEEKSKIEEQNMNLEQFNENYRLYNP